MIPVAPQILAHVLAHLPMLLIRDALLDLFTEIEKTRATFVNETHAVLHDGGLIYQGKLLDIQNELYFITGVTGIEKSKSQPVEVVPLGLPVQSQLTSRNSPIVINKGDILNYQEDAPLETTMGRLLLNYVILVDPFGDLIPYLNTIWKVRFLEENYIFENLRINTITVAQLKHYSRNLHWLGHFTELSVPSLTERALTVDPRIIVRRDELLKEHATEIAAGNSVVMNQIENELIAMDRELLKGDVSTLFYDQDSKSYEVHRKMMLITGGMIPEFGGKGFNFIGNSLEEGWDVKNFPVICNEVRRGSYSSAVQTAKGGEETKFVIRVFQNTKITCDDCSSSEYLMVTLTKETAKSFLYRNILVDGKLVTLDLTNINGYIGKTLQMRSPMYCATENGYCFTCMGELFRSIDQEVITMVSVALTSTFTKSALKAKHFVITRSIEITSLNKFVI